MYFIEVGIEQVDESVQRAVAKAVACVQSAFPNDWAALDGIEMRWVRGFKRKSDIPDNLLHHNAVRSSPRLFPWSFQGPKNLMFHVDRHFPTSVFLRAEADGYREGNRYYPVDMQVFYPCARIIASGYGHDLDPLAADMVSLEIPRACERGMTYEEYCNQYHNHKAG